MPFDWNSHAAQSVSQLDFRLPTWNSHHSSVRKEPVMSRAVFDCHLPPADSHVCFVLISPKFLKS